MTEKVIAALPRITVSPDSTPASAFGRALGELGHGVLLLDGERIVQASEALCALTGYSERELLKRRSVLELVAADERPRFAEIYRRYRAGEEVGSRFSVPIVTASGSLLDLDVAIRSYGGPRSQPHLVVVTNDVSERAEYRDQLQFQTRLLEAIAEATTEAILVVARDGRMTYFNQRFIDMWQLPAEVFDSRRDADALDAGRDKVVDPEAFSARVAYLYDHPLEIAEDELLLRDGRIIERYSAPVTDNADGPQGRVWFFRDVTEERRAKAASDILALSGELLGSPLDLEKTLSQLANLVVPLIADWAAVDVVDEHDRFQRVGVAHVDPSGAALLRELHARYPLRASEGHLRGHVLATLEPLALYEVDDDELRGLSRDDSHFEMLRRLGLRSALWIPLTVRDRVLGVLSVGYGEGARRYAASDLALLRELARRAALALDNALLYRAVQRTEARQAALATLGQQALSGMSYEAIAQSAATELARIMDVPFVEVLELRPQSHELLLAAGVGWRKGEIGRATVKAGYGSQGGYALTMVGPVVVDDLASEKRFTPPELLLSHGVISGITVVIGSPANPFGVLGTHTAERRAFAEDDVNFLQAVANVLAATRERQDDDDRLSSLAVAEQSRAAQLRTVIESIGDAVIVCDVLGVVVLANPAADSLLGSHLDGGLSGVLQAFNWPEGQDADLPPGQGIELRLANADADRWFELSSFPILGDEGSAAGGTIIVLRDVTSARHVRTARDAFLGVLSHELRTPVTTIYGSSEILSRKSAADMSEERRREVYDDIRSEADRLYRLVENLLVLSRVERQGLTIDTEPVLLQRLIPRVVESESGRWPDASWQTELPANLPPVAAEETYIEQVLRNLLGNAAKYGGGGPVHVAAESVDDSVHVRVTDSGPGFPPAEVDRLFDLFFRSPSSVRRASGAGIGLFVSRQLIEAMGGRISARNVDGAGAEFSFELPIFA